MNLEEIVPWGRDMQEYKEMFNLEDEDNILGVADGPASFAKEMRDLGKHVISADVVYQFQAADIKKRMLEVAPIIQEQLRKTSYDFNFTGRFKSVNDLVDSRLNTMNTFLKDYKKHPEFYKNASVLALPFKENCFDLALVSHFLFLYSEHLDCDFHIKAIREILRVSGEVRIFPLTDLSGKRSEHLDRVLDASKANEVEIVKCSYDFVKVADSYLKIKSAVQG
jgi:hypothetical protein